MCDSLEGMDFACTVDISLCFGQLYSGEQQNPVHTSEQAGSILGALLFGS